ncbi:hypothetical protein [Edwardsiella ictaluri]
MGIDVIRINSVLLAALTLDFYLRVVLPELSRVPRGMGVVCNGQVTLLLSVPL